MTNAKPEENSLQNHKKKCPMCLAISIFQETICLHDFKAPKFTSKKKWSELSGSEWVERSESFEWDRYWGIPTKDERRRKE